MTVFFPESINPLDLPSLALKDKSKLPEITSIYFVISEKDEILYIGRTINLKQRWAAHHRLTEFLSQYETAKVSWIEIQEANLLSSLEKSMISHFKPNLNGRRIAHLIDVTESFTMQGLEIKNAQHKNYDEQNHPSVEDLKQEQEDKANISDSPFTSSFGQLLSENKRLKEDIEQHTEVIEGIYSLKSRIKELEKENERLKIFETENERLKEVEKEYERLKMWRDSVLALAKIAPD